MSDLLWIAVSVPAGLGLGLLYFGGLWWTLRRSLRSRRPQALILGSFLGRTVLAVGVFIALSMSGRWLSVAAALAGFVLMRFIVARSI